MGDIIWLIVVILIIGWLVGYFGFGEAVGSLIHILLGLAVIGILFFLYVRMSGKKKAKPTNEQ